MKIRKPVKKCVHNIDGKINGEHAFQNLIFADSWFQSWRNIWCWMSLWTKLRSVEPCVCVCVYGSRPTCQMLAPVPQLTGELTFSMRSTTYSPGTCKPSTPTFEHTLCFIWELAATCWTLLKEPSLFRWTSLLSHIAEARILAVVHFGFFVAKMKYWRDLC